MDDITIIITSFHRPECVERLLTSIRNYYLDVAIIVVDDSERPLVQRDGVRYITLPFDSGVSAKRNAGVKEAKTNFVFIVEDDCIFTEETGLAKTLAMLKDYDCDLLGIKASGVDFCGQYLWDEPTKTIRYSKEPNSTVGSVAYYDFIPNIFLARRSVLLEHPWDESLKVGEHLAYFWKYHNEMVVGFTNTVQITHAHYQPPGYPAYRQRATEFKKDFMRKNGIKRVVDFNTDTSV